MASQFKTVYNSPYNGNFDWNSFRKVAMKDPQFALGEILGSTLSGMYANNYNNRGINKAVDKALAEYGAGGSTAADQAALQQVQPDHFCKCFTGAGQATACGAAGANAGCRYHGAGNRCPAHG